MKGLLLKDILNLKQQVKIYFIIIAVWLAMGSLNNNSSFIAGTMMILSLIVPISAIAYDEKVKWDRYALTMPISKANMVTSKYLLSLLCNGLVSVISIIAGTAITGDVKESLLTTMTIMSLGMIFASIMLPFIFRFGVEKGRLILMVLLFFPSILSIIASKLDIPMPNEETIKNIIYCLPIIALVITICSIYISVALYSRKEF